MDSSTAGIDEAMAHALSRIAPRSEAEVDAYVLRESIAPRLRHLGFGDRFCEPLALNADQLRVKKQCDGLLLKVGAIVALVGVRGTGKTSIAAQMAIERIREFLNFFNVPTEIRKAGAVRPMPYYFKAAQLVHRYKSLYADYGSLDGEALQKSLESLTKDCGLIVIDEWHECDDRKMRDRVLVDLIDRFYANRNDVLIISNQDTADFASKTNASILSRLDEHGKIIPCKWASFRAK